MPQGYMYDTGRSGDLSRSRLYFDPFAADFTVRLRPLSNTQVYLGTHLVPGVPEQAREEGLAARTIARKGDCLIRDLRLCKWIGRILPNPLCPRTLWLENF